MTVVGAKRDRGYHLKMLFPGCTKEEIYIATSIRVQRNPCGVMGETRGF